MEMMKNSIKNYLLPTMASHIKKRRAQPPEERALLKTHFN
jgi:hypothetical protein